MDYRFARTRSDEAALQMYSALFGACFPDARQLQDARYLGWLYRDNPAGAVVGFDAFAGDELAAHYVCVPATLSVHGRALRGLLSLNTATHPSHQGKGLFTKLADQTYRAGAEEGFAAVYGVANANSTPGFIRKLGFSSVGQLDAKLGIGALLPRDFAERGGAGIGFRREWDAALAAWRMANPCNPLQVRPTAANDVVGFRAATGKVGIEAWAELPTEWISTSDAPAASVSVPRARIWLGMVPAGVRLNALYREVPARVRPSPLNLIYRSLDPSAAARVTNGEVFFTFLDFDAY